MPNNRTEEESATQVYPRSQIHLTKIFLYFTEMISKTQLLVYTALALYSTPNALAEWTRVEEDNLGTTAYIDRTTFLKEKNYASFWALIDYKTSQNADGVPSRSAKAQIQYDCLGEKLRILSMTFHSRNMGLGKLIHTDSTPKGWESVSPGSIGGATFDYACGIFSDDGSKHKFSEDEIPGWHQGPSTKVADVFFDPKSIKRSKLRVRMLVITNFKMPESLGSGFAWSAKTNVEFNCSRKSSRYSALRYYDLPYEKGKPIADNQSTTNVWKPISTTGLSMGMWNIACDNN